MAGELILHLGDFKTGTTAIQDWPGTAGGIALLPGAPHVAAAGAAGSPAGAGPVWAALGRAAAEAPATRAMISSEHFEFADPARLAETLARHLPDWEGRVRLVAYVRPHPQAFLARYAESAKIGSFAGPPAAYLDWPQTGRRMRYAPRFGRWRAAFGDAFELRLYDRARFPGGDVRRDLARAVTGGDPGTLPPPRAANPAPGTRALALARAVHGAISRALDPETERAVQGARWTLGRHLGRLMAEAADPGDPPLALDRPLAEALVARFAADAAETEAAFLQGTPLSDALQEARRAAPETVAGPDPDARLSPETREIAELWGRMLAHGLATDSGAVERIWHE